MENSSFTCLVEPLPQPCISCAGPLVVLIWVMGYAVLLCLFLWSVTALRTGPAGCSSAWLQRQHLTCMESCVPQCSKCVSLSISSFALAGRRPSTAGPRIRSALEYTCSNQLNQSFTQQICIGYLLCARDWARARAHSNKRNSRNPCPHGTYVQVERSRP